MEHNRHRLLEESHKYMVKCNEGLTKIPHMQEWTADLEVVSLMGNAIAEIPAGTSPCCPRLSTLIFSRNPIKSIPECFFIHMNALAVLDLSFNHQLTSLPNSLSNLRSLISLVLKGCRALKYVPPLGELQALSRLDISGTSIEEVPQGLEVLINLKWLDLSDTDNLTLVPGSVLPGLTNMQYLNLRCGNGSDKVKVEDVQGMSMLEFFAGSFHDCKNYNNYVRTIQDRGHGPKSYFLHSGTEPEGCFEFVDGVRIAPDNEKCQIVYFGDCEEFLHLLPRDLAKLGIFDNYHWICLCDALSSNGPSSLREIEISYCTGLQSLFCLSGSCSLCTNLQNLESLHLRRLESLTVICKEDVAHITPLWSTRGVFSHLMHFRISECHKIEKLLTPRSLSQLRNLVTINVHNCNSLEEIFAVSNSNDDDDDDDDDIFAVSNSGDDGSSITLPKLTRLELSNLPKLKTVCKGIIVRGSSPELVIRDCPNLERVPAIQVRNDSDS